MNDLKRIVEQQVTEEPQPTGKYKIIGIVCVAFVLYAAFACVHSFKILTFLNEIIEPILTFLNGIILAISDFIRDIIGMY